MSIVLQGHPGIRRAVKGTALVAADNFSARYDLDRQKGVFSRPGHALFGKSYVGKILVLNTAKGGVASAWMIREMVDRRDYARRLSVQSRKSHSRPRRGLCGPSPAGSF